MQRQQLTPKVHELQAALQIADQKGPLSMSNTVDGLQRARGGLTIFHSVTSRTSVVCSVSENFDWEIWQYSGLVVVSDEDRRGHEGEFDDLQTWTGCCKRVSSLPGSVGPVRVTSRCARGIGFQFQTKNRYRKRAPATNIPIRGASGFKARFERLRRLGKMPPDPAKHRTGTCLVVTPTGIEPVSPP